MDNVMRCYSGSPWEKEVGYCRAIRSGPFVSVSGTTSMKDGLVFAPGDPYTQTVRCLAIIEAALSELGAQKHQIIRTRLFVTDISNWKHFGKAHREFFGEVVPATSMIEVASLIDPELQVEIEVDAIAT